MDEIRIDKKYCKRVKMPHQECTLISLPETSKYNGFVFYSSDWYTDETSKFVSIKRPKKSDFVFTLQKKESEAGKRYRRPKLSFDALAAEFEAQSAKFYKSNLPQVLVVHGLMLSFISAKEAAERWGISQRRVLVLCAENRIE